LQPSAASHHNVAHIDEVKVCDPSGEVINLLAMDLVH